MTIQFDDCEQDILDSVERGEWQSVANLQQEIERYRSYAIAFMKLQINAGDKPMLKTYEVTIENGQVIWLDEKPQVSSARALVTILEDTTAKPIDAQNIPRRHFPIASLAGKVKILGDIVSPIVDEEDWECLK
jgi:hypothetical protein